MADITPRQHKISSADYAWVYSLTGVRHLGLYKPRGVLSLPINDDLKSLLTLLSTRLTNKYLVTGVIQFLKQYGVFVRHCKAICLVSK